MAFESDFLELMTSTVTISHAASINSYGERAYASGTAVPCHIQEDRSWQRNQDGQKIERVYRLYLPPTVSVLLADEVTFADASKWRVMSVDARYDEDGTVHHRVATVGQLQ